MNRSLLRRISTFLFVFYVLSFGIFFFVAALRFTSELVLPSLRWAYALDRAFILFIDYLLPVHAAAIAVGASLGGRSEPTPYSPPSNPFNRIAASSLVMFMLLAVAYTLAFEITYPAAKRRLTELQHATSLARQLRRQSEVARQSGDYRTSLGLVNRYLALDPGSREMQDSKATLESLAAHQAAPPAPPKPAGEEPGVVMDAQALVTKAQTYFDQGDWFSANYYAQKASSIDPRRTDALRLAAQAAEKLAEAASPGDGKDSRLTTIYRQKRDAYLLLSAGDFLQAYYSFSKLAAEYPKDKDIATNLDRATDGLRSVSFFIDEARQIETLPGVDEILFFNSASPGGAEAVSIGRMVQAREGTYFFNVEALQYDRTGNVRWHLTAPYGKLQNETILLRCVDRNKPGVQILPSYSVGSRPAQEAAFLHIQPGVDELPFLSMQQDVLAEAGPMELWRMRDALGSFGLSRGALTLELVMKLMMPFAFLILSLLALPFGWAFRPRAVDGRPSGLAVLLVPLVPIVLSVLTLLYVYAHRVILGFVILAFGFTVALVVGAILQFVLLAVALMLLAGQSGA
jgi:tetratricopeptide (TPR) repeat protein